jgi:hypothetical protein
MSKLDHSKYPIIRKHNPNKQKFLDSNIAENLYNHDGNKIDATNMIIFASANENLVNKWVNAINYFITR